MRAVGADDDPRAFRAQASLDRLVQQFAELNAISFTADVEVVFLSSFSPETPTHEPIAGSFEYAASGSMWRKASVLDPAKYPGMNTAIAYNGSMYQYAMPDAGVTSVSVGADTRAMGMTLPNPILTFGQFLAPITDEPKDVLLREVRSAAVAWASPAIEWREVQTERGPAMRGVLPGAVYEGAPYHTHVLLPADADPSAPIVMELARESGDLLGRFTFSDFALATNESGGLDRWPTRFVAEVFDEATGARMATMAMDLHDLRVGARVERDAVYYTLPWADDTRVWVDELATFIK